MIRTVWFASSFHLALRLRRRRLSARGGPIRSGRRTPPPPQITPRMTSTPVDARHRAGAATRYRSSAVTVAVVDRAPETWRSFFRPFRFASTPTSDGTPGRRKLIGRGPCRSGARRRRRRIGRSPGSTFGLFSASIATFKCRRPLAQCMHGATYRPMPACIVLPLSAPHHRRIGGWRFPSEGRALVCVRVCCRGMSAPSADYLPPFLRTSRDAPSILEIGKQAAIEGIISVRRGL
jgi:hypothetical protein